MLLDILIAVAEKGGVESVINMTAGYLNRNGFKVRVVQLVWEHVKWVDEEIEFYPLSEGREGHTLDEFFDLYDEFLLKHDKPSVVLATAWPMMSLVAKKVSIRSNISYKIISWLHAPIEQYNRAGYGGIECLECADANFVLNHRTANILREHKISNIAVVYNPVDFEECNVINFNKLEKKNIAVFVGRLSVEKHVEIILKGIADAAEWKLLVIGDGAERNTLEELSYKLGIDDRVSFLGWQSKPWECAKDAEMLILASDYESFSLVTKEALAAGIPVVSTPVDGIIDSITPGMNGYLFPKGDYKALAQILNMFSEDKLPRISPQACRESVMMFEKDHALNGFRQAILDLVL